ncbi:hypothetical protein [Komagataeibacter sp. FXV3]|uniref:hypothetical protein n=1 Tax=Komagataeibacter sp. FXV3 TaxID=2608998 RepID=UPI00187B39ED|nr:hypothetical protein [Komagataeibacter sp. FXV3]MBE7729101.1 hypothetical protein [Komagataeibacter sp. FXV3]
MDRFLTNVGHVNRNVNFHNVRMRVKIKFIPEFNLHLFARFFAPLASQTVHRCKFVWKPKAGICFGVVDADAIYARVTVGQRMFSCSRMPPVTTVNDIQAVSILQTCFHSVMSPWGSHHLDLGITTVEK